MSAFVARTAVVEEGVKLGSGTQVHHFCHLRSGAEVGKDCSLGQGVHVAGGVVIGHRVKVQNHVSLFTGLIVEDDVFLGPSCVTTNVNNPRAEISRRDRYETTRICRGATVCAGAVILPGVCIGRFAFIAAGSVVTHDVGDYVLVMGVPARAVGWMSRHGHRLAFQAGSIESCSGSGLRYEKDEHGHVRCLDLREGELITPELAAMNAAYRVTRGDV